MDLLSQLVLCFVEQSNALVPPAEQRLLPRMREQGRNHPRGKVGMVQPGEKGFGGLGEEMGVAHPEGNLGMIYSGHGLPRGDNENIPAQKEMGIFHIGRKWGLSVYLARRKQTKKNNKMTTKLKQVKSSLKKKRCAMGENFHDKKGVAHPEKKGCGQ